MATERKLDSHSIASEILHNYKEAVQNADVIKQKAIDDFLLSQQMKNFFDLLKNCDEINICKDKLSSYALELVHDSEYVTSNTWLMEVYSRKFHVQVWNFIKKCFNGRL